MKTSDQIDQLAIALAKAQGEMSPAAKDSTNSHFRAKYADLASAWMAAQGPITRNGLAVIQAFDTTPEKALTIITRLVHSSGQWVESCLYFYPVDQKPQTLGSCITYGRRYSLMAILGIVPDEDDDGNQASLPQAREPAPVTPKYDARNEAHRSEFKKMMQHEFPQINPQLYAEISSDLHGKVYDWPSLIFCVRRWTNRYSEKLKEDIKSQNAQQNSR
jgi:hypothetical protein